MTEIYSPDPVKRICNLALASLHDLVQLRGRVLELETKTAEQERIIASLCAQLDLLEGRRVFVSYETVESEG